MKRIIFGLLVVIGASAAEASWYVGFGSVDMTVDGDFDGRTMVSGGGSEEMLPDWDGARGSRVTLGLDALSGASELSWERADLGGVWGNESKTGRYNAYNWDMKRRWGSLLPERSRVSVEPVFLMGMSAMSVSVDEGSVGVDGEVRNARFSGFGYRIGGGLNVRPTKSLRIELLGTYRTVTLAQVHGIADGSIKDLELSGNGLSYSLEATYTFKRK